LSGFIATFFHSTIYRLEQAVVIGGIREVFVEFLAVIRLPFVFFGCVSAIWREKRWIIGGRKEEFAEGPE
jgi:hypothetical protein